VKKLTLILLAMTITTAAWAKNNKEAPAGPCRVGIATVVMGADGPQADVAPDFYWHWWKKILKRYPGFCAVRKDSPLKDGPNFLLAFSSNESRFSGFVPVRRWSRDRTHPSMVPAPPVTEHRLMLNVCLLLFRLCDGGQVLYDLVRRILQFDQMSIVFVDGL